MFAAFGRWWRAFDAFGRKFMNYSNPILGSQSIERRMIEEGLRQQREAKERDNNG